MKNTSYPVMRSNEVDSRLVGSRWNWFNPLSYEIIINILIPIYYMTTWPCNQWEACTGREADPPTRMRDR